MLFELRGEKMATLEQKLAKAQEKLRHELVNAGIIKSRDFFTAAGLPADTKVEWGVVDRIPHLTARAAGLIALQSVQYKPDLVVAIPTGGYVLADAVAKELELPCVQLDWIDKQSSGNMFYPYPEHKEAALQAEAVALIDDVFTTGRTLSAASNHPTIKDRVVVYGVGWDRSSPETPKDPDVPLVVAVREHVPLLKPKEMSS